MTSDPLLRNLIAGLLSLALVAIPAAAHADTPITLYYYGTESDGNLGRETAFATWWSPPTNVPLTVRPDWRGVALNGWRPGAEVIITVVGVPEWTASWPDLDLIGNSTLAVVADRPGGPYGDAWQSTFRALAPLWVGKLYVTIEASDSRKCRCGTFELW